MQIAGFEVKSRWIVTAVIALVSAIAILICAHGIVGVNNMQDFTVCQPIVGSPWIQSAPGPFAKWFATTWPYPKVSQVFFSKNTDEGPKDDQSIRVTFNDGGEADISVMVRYQNPLDAPGQFKLHDNFRGNQHDIMMAVRSHVSNCIKTTGPMMSASEHQSARKAEFNQLVEEQLRNGLYVMKRVDKMIDDPNAPTALMADTANDTGGIARKAEVHKIAQSSTEIVRDADGKPMIAQESPLKKFGIQIEQFSVTRTDYDDKTREMFAAKKESYLIAEKMKAQRQEEIANRMMVIEKGLREKASVEAEANKTKAEQTIKAEMAVVVAEQAKKKAETEAQQLVTVAEQKKLEAETQAKQLVTVAEQTKLAAEVKAKQEVTVAEQTKLAAEVKAKQELAVAELAAKSAEQKALAVKTLADAEKQRIAMAGAITEKEQVLATIAAEKDVKIASALANIQSPGMLVMGNGSGKDGKEDGNALTQNLMSIWMLREMGIVKPTQKTLATANATGK